jgi:hypothetical protein
MTEFPFWLDEYIDERQYIDYIDNRQYVKRLPESSRHFANVYANISSNIRLTIA